jgi:zinc transport system substrate-binding protein
MKVAAFILGLALVAGAAFLLLGNDKADAEGDDGRLRVLTTILPIYCFAANIAGEEARVENLLPGGVGPHEYQFSPRDLRKIQQADLIILNGLGLENWLEKALQAGKQIGSVQRVEASAGLGEELIYERSELKLDVKPDPRRRHRHDHGDHFHDHSGPNPHFWLDPRLAAHAVTNILEAFQAADPERSEIYARNAEDFLERLEVLDAELARALAPLKGAAFVTYHDAFPYFVRRYDLNLAGVIEEVPEVQPSIRYLQQLLEVIREKEVRVIFTEPQFSGRLAGRMSRDLNVPLAELDPLETGPLEAAAYEEGMRRNAATLKEYLQ